MSKHDRLLDEQRRSWPNMVAMGKQGNPFATLCRHCYGRHAPPRDEICPHESIEAVKVRHQGGPASIPLTKE